MDRQLVVQDIIDCRGFEILPSVLSAPVSPVFRLRAISAMCQDIRNRPRDKQLVMWLDGLFKDNPNYLDLVHCYDSTPCGQFLLEELFQPDFSRCYLALLSLSLHKSDTLWPYHEPERGFSCSCHASACAPEVRVPCTCTCEFKTSTRPTQFTE